MASLLRLPPVPRLKPRSASLILSDGTRFKGRLVGAPLVSSGQMVFTTGMVGYPETITDPSYFGQIVVFSYPLIGNYGIPPDPHPLSGIPPRGLESDRVRASGIVLGAETLHADHWAAGGPLGSWLERQGVPGIAGLDCRALVTKIRSSKLLLGRIVPEDPTGERDLGAGFYPAREGFFDPGAQCIMPAVSNREPIRLGKGKRRVAVLDTGVKWGILRALLAAGVEVEVRPWDSDLESVDCDGWLLSNGPGDPVRTGPVVPRLKKLLKGSRPVLGICLGHQLLGLAAGARTSRMRYGHRSHNQPVLDVVTRRGALTSQNHGYVVEADSLKNGWAPWFVNVNDGTLEGLRHRSKPWRSVQFHPEASAGPRDTTWIIADFAASLGRKR